MSPTQAIRRSDTFLVRIIWSVAILILALQSLAWVQLLSGMRAMAPWPVRIVTVAWLALCVVWVRADIRRAGGIERFSFRPRSWALRLAAAAYLLMLLNTLISFPSGFDAIHYHLILPLEWLRNGGIYNP